MFGLLEKVAKTAVGIASLPTTVTYDIITDSEDEENYITPKVVDSIGENLEKIATGDWNDDK